MKLASFEPKTKRLIICAIGTIGLVVSIGWAAGRVEANDALIILPAILTGCFSLLKGGE